MKRSLWAASTALLALLVAGGAFVHSRADTRKSGSTASAASVPGCVGPGPGTHRIVVDSAHPPVALHVPPGAQKPGRPLIIVMPGAGQTASDIANYTGYSHLADQKGFLVAYPTATGSRPFWNVSGSVPGKPDDVAYLRKVITTLTKVSCADKHRVGMTGVSNGGGMTARMACDAADLLAAAAPVAGGYSTLPDCHPMRPLPILEIHGVKDQVVPYNGKRADHADAVGNWLRAWLARDHCTGAARRSAPAGDVQELRWTCPDDRMVVHDRVLDAQHGWPGESSFSAFSSTVRTWRFLTSFRLDVN
ncbi:MAG TPA: PHB depolymerase family esterase [Baekduia sp.]|uniref:alpha/beta hydrolase family esterase n=1 Tax=Baekduia sp. TaxID=2600305 RepID=UPI002D781BB0|nr:PHB depolymerase family esterase [Baekduia sp.]HET6507466.1 PHB depolymerase family esterase [Baekduia sp.]